MSDTMSIADVLERAADLIEPEGAWTQGAAYRDDQGDVASELSGSCMCLLGAIWVVRGGIVDGREADFLAPLLGQWPADWNDAPERTQAEVVAKLREAAAFARATVSEGEG